MRSFDEVPARLLFDLFYCLVLDETKDRVERRQELDGQLAAVVPAVGGEALTPAADRSDRERRAARWGKTPAQQRAMRNAMNAGGAQANVAGRRRARG